MTRAHTAAPGGDTRRSRAPRRPTWSQLWAGATVLAIAALLLVPGWLAPSDPYHLDVSQRFQPPTAAHLFGTDDAGRDIFSRVVHGARYSIGTSVVVVTAAALFGTVYGAAAAWFGGALDRVLMRVVDVFLAFPYLVFAMAISASLGRGLTSALIALVALWWPSYARMVRGQVLSLIKDYHVRAARTLGASGPQILRWHVLPHTYDQVLVRYTLDLGQALIALTGLSFLGLGAQPPTPEWGLLIADAKQYALTAWWAAVLPGCVVFLVTLNFMSLGDRLRRRGGPR
ncbi:ABC transporter permease [Acrocarpospora catenulata]|uniref:ABC transporter permease n=1 Tax=Acrocarpospora catenulata TaxID=2836182 RepID=UPI001BD99329|nr:ABC transporter permease [Acrocarpospora catenulata]